MQIPAGIVIVKSVPRTFGFAQKMVPPFVASFVGTLTAQPLQPTGIGVVSLVAEELLLSGFASGLEDEEGTELCEGALLGEIGSGMIKT